MRLNDKVCLVTGAAQGIGRAAAERYLAEGARVAIVDRNVDLGQATAAALGASDRVQFFQADVSLARDVQAMVQGVVETFGRIDVLVNNAGYYPIQPFDSISVDDWDRVIDINLKSVFLCSRAVLPHMRAQGGGKIINLCSAVIWMGNPNLVHYATAKAGVLGFTRTFAHVAGPDGITVNALAPGLVLTETVAGDRPISELDARAQLQAVKRRAYPNDMTGTLVFLASSDSDFMTGQTLVVDGGRVLN